MDYMNLQFEGESTEDIFEEIKAVISKKNPNIETIIEYEIDIKIVSRTPISRTKSRVLVVIPVKIKYESNLKIYTTTILVKKYLNITKESDKYVSSLYIKYANMLEQSSRFIDFYLILGAKTDRIEKPSKQRVDRPKIKAPKYRR